MTHACPRSRHRTTRCSSPPTSTDAGGTERDLGPRRRLARRVRRLRRRCVATSSDARRRHASACRRRPTARLLDAPERCRVELARGRRRRPGRRHRVTARHRSRGRSRSVSTTLGIAGPRGRERPIHAHVRIRRPVPRRSSRWPAVRPHRRCTRRGRPGPDRRRPTRPAASRAAVDTTGEGRRRTVAMRPGACDHQVAPIRASAPPRTPARTDPRRHR